MPMEYDAVIIGGGPAGMFAAHRLAGMKKKVLLVDKGKSPESRKCPLVTEGKCSDCSFCDMMYGIGGSGLFSDGKLNLDPSVGGNLLEFVDRKAALDLIEEVDLVFRDNGMKSQSSEPKEDEARLAAKAAKAGIRFVPIRQRHIGSDMLPGIMGRFMKSLEEEGVKFQLESEVADITVGDGRVRGVTLSDGTGVESESVLIAPGRGGERWLHTQAGKLGLKMTFNPIDVGVRVEVPSMVMDDVINVNWDPKFHIYTKTHDDFVRTFCTCPYGFVTKESYEGFNCVNGHSMQNKKSQNTNFAFLVNVGLTEPVENSIAYGESIARLATTIGGGKPVLQRLTDLRIGRRSTWARIDRGFTSPTMRDATPGDISMALPKRVVTDIIEGLDALDKVIPGVASDSTLLYAPEIKFHSMRIHTSPKSLETAIKGLFVAGDGAGVSRGIVIAAATGMLAADGILQGKT